MALYHYVYTSNAVSALNTSELEAILHSARIFNEKNNITGMLLYCNETFMQLLEGEKEDIYSLMDERISQDSRHHTIYTIKETEVSERSFAGWSMGFSNLGVPETQVDKSFTRFLEEGLT